MQKRNLAILLGVCLLLAACANKPGLTESETPAASGSASNLKSGTSEQTMAVNGLNRSYQVYLPPAITSQQPLPLVLVLHGGGGNAEYAEKMSKMSDKAAKEGFIAVYPEGTGNRDNILLTWNADFCCAYAMNNKVDDVGFIRALLEKLEKSYPIDAKRIYVTGMSNGAMLTYRLGVELSDKIAAIAPVAGAMSGSEPAPKQPLAVIAFHGLEDTSVPYQGGPSRNAVVIKASKSDYQPVSTAISYWVKNDGTANVAQKEEKGNIIKETYSGGKNGTEVVLYTIKNGGHSWPGGYKWSSTNSEDAPTQEISATDLMWEFFKQHPKK